MRIPVTIGDLFRRQRLGEICPRVVFRRLNLDRAAQVADRYLVEIGPPASAPRPPLSAPTHLLESTAPRLSMLNRAVEVVKLEEHAREVGLRAAVPRIEIDRPAKRLRAVFPVAAAELRDAEDLPRGGIVWRRLERLRICGGAGFFVAALREQRVGEIALRPRQEIARGGRRPGRSGFRQARGAARRLLRPFDLARQAPDRAQTRGGLIRSLRAARPRPRHRARRPLSARRRSCDAPARSAIAPPKRARARPATAPALRCSVAAPSPAHARTTTAAATRVS